MPDANQDRPEAPFPTRIGVATPPQARLIGIWPLTRVMDTSQDHRAIQADASRRRHWAHALRQAGARASHSLAGAGRPVPGSSVRELTKRAEQRIAREKALEEHRMINRRIERAVACQAAEGPTTQPRSVTSAAHQRQGTRAGRPSSRTSSRRTPSLLTKTAVSWLVRVMEPRSNGFPKPGGGLPDPSESGPGPVASQKEPSNSMRLRSIPQWV